MYIQTVDHHTALLAIIYLHHLFPTTLQIRESSTNTGNTIDFAPYKSSQRHKFRSHSSSAHHIATIWKALHLLLGQRTSLKR
jgi:hypothetical protein